MWPSICPSHRLGVHRRDRPVQCQQRANIPGTREKKRTASRLSPHHISNHVDTTNPEKVREVLTPKTAMVLLETPTNPLIKIVDIPAVSSFAHTASPSCIVSVDNTMLSPLLQNPLELGADIVYESGTKYLSGHHDLMAGVLAINDESLGEKLYFTINASGCGLSPFDSWLLMRGIKTLKVRMDAQQANAMLIAKFLESCG